jgi:hypothetical protein
LRESGRSARGERQHDGYVCCEAHNYLLSEPERIALSWLPVGGIDVLVMPRLFLFGAEVLMAGLAGVGELLKSGLPILSCIAFNR